MTAALAAALVAMTLMATPAHAQCTVGDITMTRTFPTGGKNLSRGGDLLTNNTIIRFDIGGDCPPADPPLTACVDVWDTGNPGVLPRIRRTGG